jgi:ABC-type branched-subunit amino acid transport system ATPase component
MGVTESELRTVLPPPTEGANGAILLHAQGLRKAFGAQVVLDMAEDSLELSRGEVVLLRGANGSGKTTLLNILTGNLDPDSGSIDLFTRAKKTSFTFPSSWVNQFALSSFTPELLSRAGIGRTWQETRLFSTQSLRNNIAVATPDQLGENPHKPFTRPIAVKRQEAGVRTTSDNILSRLGLRGREISSCDKISLGQSKRVAIASSVQAGAQILFLDEPLAGLDSPGITDVIALLGQLVREQQITLVIVEHVFNIQRILDLATTVWTLEKGRVRVESPSTVEEEIRHLERNGIQEWMLDIAGSDCTILQQSLTGGATLTTITPSTSTLNDVVLEVKDIAVRRGNRLVVGSELATAIIEGVSFVLSRGQIGVLEAPNGWGKTTLLEAIAGTLPIVQGEIRLNRSPIHKSSSWKRAQLGMSYLQARDNTFPNLDVREVFKLAGIDSLPDRLGHLTSKKMSDLSGGEKQSVSLVCATPRKFGLGLLDEPFASLDVEAVQRTASSLLEGLRDTTLLIATPATLQ